MVNFSNNRAKRIIRFTKWSNTAFAIFNSIGKVVHVGKLSKIIHGLITVKSILFQNTIEIKNSLCIDEELEILLKDLDSIIELLKREERVLITARSVSVYQACEISANKNKILFIISKAFSGLFSFTELSFFRSIRFPSFQKEQFIKHI